MTETTSSSNDVTANELLRKFKDFIASNSLSVSTISSVFLALILGTICKWLIWGSSEQSSIDPFILRYLNLPGLIYIRLFMVLIVPLLVTSLSTSLLNKDDDNQHQSNNMDNPNRSSTGLWITEDLRKQSIAQSNTETIDPKKLLLTTFGFFITFSSCTILLGIILVTVIGPGRGVSTFLVDNHHNSETNHSDSKAESIETIKAQFLKSGKNIDSIYNIALNLFPDNLISTLFATQLSVSSVVWPANETEILHQNYVPSWKNEFVTRNGTNMLGLCVISLALGLILQNLGVEKTRSIRSLLYEANEIVFYVMNLLMRIMPLGLFCWMFVETLKMRSLSMVATQLVHFFLVTILAFSIVLFVFYPLVYFLFTRERNPFSFYGKIGSAILVAIGSTSSAITLPMTMKCMQENAGLNQQVARFVLPLGMTVHMNGTGMYLPMVAVFVAQFKGIQLDISSLILLGIFSLVMSMGFPATAGGGPIVMMAAGSIIGIDDMQDMIAYFLTFEWIIERIRTANNVIGDCFVSKCIEVWLGVASKPKPIIDVTTVAVADNHYGVSEQQQQQVKPQPTIELKQYLTKIDNE